jgi:hypothetical protein
MSEQTKTKLIDLDEVASQQMNLAIRLHGKTYEMETVTMERYFELQKVTKSLSVEASEEEEFRVLAQMIVSVFPKMTLDVINQLTFPQVTQLMNAVLAAQNPTGEDIKNEEGKSETETQSSQSTLDSSSAE